MNQLEWSPQAHRWHKAAQSARKSQAELEREAARMRRGPHLAGDGHTLIVPSDWYQKQAAAFWKAHGFRWHGEDKTWRRDTRRPYNGARYSPSAWLESARREFYRFQPKLATGGNTNDREKPA